MLGNGDHHLDHAQSLCPFKMLTGFPCPGCGITKSIVYFYQGDLYKSLSFHVLGPFAVVFSAAAILVLTAEISTGKEFLNGYLYNRKLAYALAILLAIYHLVRLVLFIRSYTWDEILAQSIWK